MAVSTSTAKGNNAITKLLVAGVAAGIVAAVVNVIIYLVSSFALGINIQVPQPPDMATFGPLPFPAVIMASIVPAIGAALLLWILGLMAGSRAWIIFVVISVGFLLFSFYPVSQVAAFPGSMITLGLMHIGAGAAIVGTLYARTQR